MLGQDIFSRFSEEEDVEIIPLSRFNVDVLDVDELQKAFTDYTPDVVINGTAFSDVDAAEREENEDLVFALNADVPGLMAMESQKIGAKFIHFSTDYIFNGEKGEYDESAEANPINVYGESKYEGELAVFEKNPDAIIARVARLYGSGRENFVQKLAFLAKRNRPIKAITDEIGNFTYCADVADALLSLLQNVEAKGIYHLVGSEPCTPYDLAEYIVGLMGSKSEIEKIISADLDRLAERPKNTSLVNMRCDALPGYRGGVKRFLGC